MTSFVLSCWIEYSLEHAKFGKKIYVVSKRSTKNERFFEMLHSNPSALPLQMEDVTSLALKTIIIPLNFAHPTATDKLQITSD